MPLFLSENQKLSAKPAPTGCLYLTHSQAAIRPPTYLPNPRLRYEENHFIVPSAAAAVRALKRNNVPG
ncbi:hypothetical protein [Argonema galeatum]|uniref:hypothetical protein n=1 Tax=Argonema galeatum TaxID=2942762 RepID=UPI0020122EA0|nr:hypothetical protein [Argonema galeatum]